MNKYINKQEIIDMIIIIHYLMKNIEDNIIYSNRTNNIQSIHQKNNIIKIINSMIFEKKCYMINLEQEENEPQEWYIDRGYFVVSQMITTTEEYNEAVKYSRIFVNYKYNKCGYNTEIENKLKKMIANMLS